MSRKDKRSNKTETAKEEFNTFLKKLSKKYPELDVKGIILDDYLKEANENKKSEMMEFKSRAESTFGTDHEMNFYDIESGLFSSMLADGRNAMKEIMEKIPCKHPVNANGEKMIDKGKEKKHNLLFRIGRKRCKNPVHRRIGL